MAAIIGLIGPKNVYSVIIYPHVILFSLFFNFSEIMVRIQKMYIFITKKHNRIHFKHLTVTLFHAIAIQSVEHQKRCKSTLKVVHMTCALVFVNHLIAVCGKQTYICITIN